MLRHPPDDPASECRSLRLSRRLCLRLSPRPSLRLFAGRAASGAGAGAVSPDTDFSCLPMLPPVLPAWAVADVAPANETAEASSAQASQRRAGRGCPSVMIVVMV